MEGTGPGLVGPLREPHHQGESMSPCIRFRAGRSLPFWVPGAAQIAAVSMAWALPEVPAVDRDIANIVGGEFTRPHLPPLRTTADGRVGLNLKSEAGKLSFFLLRPESLDEPFLDSPSGATILATTQPYALSPSLFDNEEGDFAKQHQTLCDATSEFPQAGQRINPYPCDSDDCYDVTVLVAGRVVVEEEEFIRFWGTPITVRVSDPKTPEAQIADIVLGEPVPGPLFPGHALFEPMVTDDGQLMVTRIATPNHHWVHPESGEVFDQYVDLVYAANPDECCPCDVERWTEFHPISHAPHDPQVNARYGFAMNPFRDTQNEIIPDGWDLRVTYPWLDRQGRNLFFSAVSEKLGDRYPSRCLPGSLCGESGDEGGKTRGHAMLGLWTRGKMVLLDNVLNNIDYGLDLPDSSQRLVSLYEPGTGPAGTEAGEVRMGSGRDNVESHGHPPGAVNNTTILDSPENLFNFSDAMRPVTSQDVVWLINNGKASEEVAFDDYLSVNGFIVSNMMATLEFDLSNRYANNLVYHNGWNADLRMQNAATSDRWSVPPYGAVIGGGRLEPGAMGGIHGRGLWLDGHTWVEYEIAPQPIDVSTSDWYVGLWVDSRFPDDQKERVLLSFPDGSEVRLEGRHRILLLDPNSRVANGVALPSMLPEKGWAHLGFDVLDGGTRVVTYVDGFALHRWVGPAPILQLLPGDLYVGHNGGLIAPGFTGWIDDLKIFAEKAGSEVACNHAGGTLIGLTDSYQGHWADVANRYPTWTHEKITDELLNRGEDTFDRFACYHDYTADLAAHRGNVPAETQAVRSSLLFPEGPLVYDAPRPDVSRNSFCVRCHQSGGKGGLGLEALQGTPEVAAVDDPRRQPMQPFRVVSGHIPADWIAPGVPPMAQRLSDQGSPIDRWVQESIVQMAPDVVGFTLVNAETGGDLTALNEGDTLDLSLLGAVEFNIRANATGFLEGVSFVFDGELTSDFATPFSVFGDRDGVYLGEDLLPGAHELSAVPSDGSGPGVSIGFTVMESGAVIVSHYQGDFRANAPAPGWNYLWNEGGPIGEEENYSALRWDLAERYDSDGAFGIPDATPAGWASLDQAGGRPGYGTGDGQKYDRYVIAAYTIDRGGFYSVIRSSIKSLMAGDGAEVRIYTDEHLQTQMTYPGLGSTIFDRSLGWLPAGTAIYVAVGPDGASKSDRFAMDFCIARRHAGVTVADYRADFQGENSARGWRYLWNEKGEIGESDGYRPLVWDGATRYDSDGSPGLPDTTEMGWGSLHADGGRTGYGVEQGNPLDRFAIAEFEVDRGGRYFIERGIVAGLNGGGTGFEVRLYRADELIRGDVHGAGTSAELAADLGWVEPAERIHVAMGPHGHSGLDVYGLDFRIERVPLDVAIRLNGRSFGSGDTLRVGIRVSNPGLPVAVDWYLGHLWPDGDTITFLDSAREIRLGSRSVLSELEPFYSSSDLMEPLEVNARNFYQEVVFGSEMGGAHTAFFVGLVPGALRDGRIDRADWIARSTEVYKVGP